MVEIDFTYDRTDTDQRNVVYKTNVTVTFPDDGWYSICGEEEMKDKKELLKEKLETSCLNIINEIEKIKFYFHYHNSKDKTDYFDKCIQEADYLKNCVNYYFEHAMIDIENIQKTY